MLKEFKEFAMRGNVIDLAVGIIIGAAFTTVVNSLVKDIIMPPIGYIMNGIDFSNFFVVLKGDTYASLKTAQDAGACLRKRFTCLTRRNTANATIRKLMQALMKTP